MTKFSLLFVGLVLGLLASVISLGKSNFSATELRNIIESNKITRIDDLVTKLPVSLRSNPLLVYESRALNRERVTFETPRIILFNEDASLIMAYTRNPGQSLIHQGDDRLEILEFNSMNRKFELKELVFDGRNSPFSRPITTNPQTCLKCHGSNPVPIFPEYNSWPGFYGSFGTKGYAVQGSAEFQGLKRFLALKDAQPRYRDLDFGGYSLDSLGMKTTSRGMGEMADKIQFSINLMFGTKIENLMWQRLGYKLVHDRNFKDLAPLFYALGEESNRCGPIRGRIKAIAKVWINTPERKRRSQMLLTRINQQTAADHELIEAQMVRTNSVNGQIDLKVDPRGVSNMLYSNLKNLGSTPESPLDQKAFFGLLLFMESSFRHLGYSILDISTTPDKPTAGTFHLKRLGRRAVDEQFFQNLFSGISDASPAFKRTFDNLSCAELDRQVLKTLSLLEVPDPQKSGILYRRNY